jgi:sporulation protein YlmC with PRC-barrel domain
MTRTSLLAAFLALATAGVAQAQTRWMEVGDTVVVMPFGISAGVVEDMDVVDAAGKKLGEVEHVIGLTPQEATAVTIDLDDNVGLSAREGDVIVPLAGIQIEGDRVRLLDDAATVGGYEIYPD